MKVTRAWNRLRNDLFNDRVPIEDVLARLQASDHPDAPVLYNFLNSVKHTDRTLVMPKLARSHHDSVVALYGELHSVRENWRGYSGLPPVLDHSISYLLTAVTLDAVKEVADTYNEPLAHVIMWMHTDYSSLQPAIDLDESVALEQLLLHQPPMSNAVRTELWLKYIECDTFNKASDYLLVAYCDNPDTELRPDETLRYLTGRLVVHAKAQKRGGLYRDCASTYKFQLARYREASLAAYWCLRKRGVVKDVVRMIGQLVWSSRAECLYKPRRSKRVKK